MKRLLLSMFRTLSLVSVLLLAACDTVLQYPDGNGFDPNHPHGKVKLTIRADMDFLHLGEFEYDFENPYSLVTSRDAPPAPHQLRYSLKAFRVDDNSVSPAPLASMVFTLPMRPIMFETLDIELLPGEYRLVLWADYVEDGTDSDKYYDTGDFAEIVLMGEDGHYGSTVFREAFYGETTLRVRTATDPVVYAIIDLVRPMAKYTFVSNDLDDFLDREIKNRNNSKGDDDSSDASLDDYHTRIVYTQYMPSSFNVHTGKPVDSRLGVEYHSRISALDDQKAQLGFDYVFTNGSDTSVAVAMEVTHTDGTVVARMPQFDVPLRRGHHTIVTGKFLTTKSSGDIGISPEFDGEFNIFIK